MELVVDGTYQHFKGNYYRVVGVAKHSETYEEMVVYQDLCGEGLLWVRPKAMFIERVLVDGVEQDRFRYLGPNVS
jgi:hypothetical protein